MFQPNQANLWHEAGLLYAQIDRIVDAIHAFENFLSKTTAEEKRYKISMLLQELRNRLN
jgi:regulator of sirC expression with transglutaminase-like and TPR domain